MLIERKENPGGSRRKATQWVWFFFWIFVAGVVWPIFSDGNNAPVPCYLVTVGMWGWFGALIYRWLKT